MKPMNVLKIVTAVSIFTNSLGGLASTQAPKSMADIAARVAENIYYIQDAKAHIEQVQTEMNAKGEMDSLDKATAAYWIAAGVTGAATVYMGYKTKNAKDIRVVFWGLGTLLSGVTAFGLAGTAAGGDAVDYIKDQTALNQLREEMAKSREQLAALEERNQNMMSQLEAKDPQIKEKVLQVISSEGFRLTKIQEIRGQLAEAKSKLSNENTELGMSGFLAASSIYSLGKSLSKNAAAFLTIMGTGPRQSEKLKMIIGLSATVAFSIWTVKNIKDRKAVVGKIEALEAQLGDIELSYKAAIAEALQAE